MQVSKRMGQGSKLGKREMRTVLGGQGMEWIQEDGSGLRNVGVFGRGGNDPG